MQHKKVVVVNNHGEKLVGILHETGSKELVIVCHGFKSSKDRIPMVNLAAAFEKGGISAFRFDFAGNGESEGSFQYGNYHREADDLHTVVEHFRQNGRFITAIIGHSKGGNAVLLYASKYRDIPTVINIAGRYNLKRGIEGRLGKNYLEQIKQDGFIDVKNRRGKVEYRVTEESLRDRLTTDTRLACQTIPLSCRSRICYTFNGYEFLQPKEILQHYLISCVVTIANFVIRVLTIHGSMDEMVPVDDALEFAKYIPTHTLHIIEGADHEFTLHQDEMASLVVAFVMASVSNEEITKPSESCVRKHKSIHSRF
nr:putative esterase [Ipomoea batatas]